MNSTNIDFKALAKSQAELAAQIKLTSLVKRPTLIAGSDVSYSTNRDMAFGAIVLFTFPELKIVEVCTAHQPSTMPYVPGFLSFRELPVLLQAYKQLQKQPDVILCDGQGIAHPRGLGLASHLGYTLNIPAIGCGKTRLVGEYSEIGSKKWSEEALMYKGNHVGSVLRTRDNIRPLFISPGHLINIEDSVAIVKQCIGKYAQPEPNRIAHHVITRYRKEFT